MKLTKRLLAFFLCFALLLPMLPASALAAEGDDVVKIDNGFIEVSVSRKNGGFLVNTVEGNVLRKSDNNKNLLFHSDEYDTSFVSFRVGSGASAKDYLFGGKYDGASDVNVTQTEDGAIIATWSVDKITFTQSITLAESTTNEHGMASISLAAKNDTGAALPIQARILLDTCLGDRDYAYYQVSDGSVTHTLDFEQIITDEVALKSFYALDDLANPAIAAYVISTPKKAAVAHWNNLAASLFDFAPDTALNFTNPINEYMTADSACALYYDLGTVANGGTEAIVSYYGVYSNHTVSVKNCMAVNTVAPMRLTLNDNRTEYVRLSDVGVADFTVTVSGENYRSDTAEDLTNVVLAVRSTSGLRPLSDEGEPVANMDYDTADPLTIPYTSVPVGRTVTKTLYFQAKKLEHASYERITVGFYKNEATVENLLGEKNVYVLLPGGDGGIPKVCFNSLSPATIYNAGTRHLYVGVTNALLLSDSLDAGNCVFRAYRSDGRVVKTIPSSIITVNVSDGVADIALTDEENLSLGGWKLQLEWSDAAVASGVVAAEHQKQTAEKLKFSVSDDPKYRNDTYGVLAAVKYGKGTSQFPYYYRIKQFPDEDSFKKFASEKNHEWVEILLVIRGAFTMDKRYVEKDSNGKVLGGYYFSAVSKKSVDPKTRESRVDSRITINNCLDFEAGTIAVYYEDYQRGGSNAVNSAICVEFDGELYTSNARTSVWTGQAAITKLEQGGDFSLLHYDADGNREDSNADPLVLIWPNAASYAQTLAGMIFKLAYGQFGVMEDNGEEIGRVVSFAAGLELSFLHSPEGDDTDYGTASYFGRMKELWKDWRGASIYQYAYHGNRYEKLVDIDMNDSDDSEDNQKGVKTSVMIPDILFGCGQGLVGLNFTVELTFKNMVESLGEISGTLSVNTINNWSFGVEGKCELIDDVKMEARLKFKSYNDIPIPDELYFYIGGFKPGLCIDPCGVVWITGAGGGFSGLYDTIFYTGGVPPLKLIMTMSLAALQILEGTATMEVSGSGIRITASDLKIADVIKVVKKISIGLEWYPNFQLDGSVQISMFEGVIEGQGYIIVLGKDYTDWLFEMYVRAALNIPESIPVVGGTTLASVDLGVSTEKIWGALKILLTDVSVVYFWGEDSVDFSLSAGSAAKPTFPELLTLSGYDESLGGIPVAHDEENHRTLYARIGTNLEAPLTAQILSDGDLRLMGAEGVWSNVDKKSHRFNLGEWNAANNASRLLQMNFEAASLEEAKTTVAGFTITDGQNGTGEALPLVLYDGSNIDTANANVTFNEDLGVASFGFSVTDPLRFDKNWYVTTTKEADLLLYNVLPLPELTSVSADATLSAGGAANVNWTGTGLGELDSVSFFLTTSEDPRVDAGYGIGSLTSGIDAGTAGLTVPGDVPAGDYYLRAVYSKDNQVNAVIHSTAKVHVDNANTPAAIGTPTVAPAGDLKLGVTIPETTDANTTGYLVSVYNADGSETDINGMTFERAKSGDTQFEIGGSYVAPVKASVDDPDAEVTGTETVGLKSGESYKLGITPYKLMDTDDDGKEDTAVYGEEYMTGAIVLPAVVTPAAALTAEGKTLTALKDMAAGEAIPVFTTSDLEIATSFSGAVTGAWMLDSSASWATDETDESIISGTFDSTSGTVIPLAGLSDGDHTLNVSGRGANGDRFAYSYLFTVDTTAPRLILGSPLNGSMFNADGTLTVTGITDTTALLTVAVDGRKLLNGKTVTDAGGTLDADGLFELGISIPDYNNASAHTVEIYAADASGNRTEEHAVTVMHPGLGDLADLVLMANGTVPADGNIATVGGGSATLKVLGVTSNGTRFVLDQDLVIWNSYAAEGSAAIDGNGVLTYTAGARGFAEASIEVSTGAYRSAALTLGSEPETSFVSVSATLGGTASGGGYFAMGETVVLTATADEGYVFDHWELTGVTVEDTTAATISFQMPGTSVTAQAVFRAEEPPEPDQQLVTVSATTGGTASGGGYYAVGATVTLTATASSGYVFDHWELSGITVSDVRAATISFPMPNNPVTAKAVFHKQSAPGQDPLPTPPNLPAGTDGSVIGFADVPAGVNEDLYVPYYTDANGNRILIPMSAVIDGQLVYLKPAGGEVSFLENAVSFTDIGGHWAEHSILWAAARGLFNGVGDGRFDPSGTMTRAMFVTVLYRIAQSPAVSGQSGFTDVEPGAWYESAVIWAKQHGIVNGVSATEFAPNAEVTREQMCTFVGRFLRMMGYSLPQGTAKTFTDADKIAAYARDDVAYCQRAGLINGYPDGSFNPKGNATRAENAAIMQRMIEAILLVLKAQQS